MEHIYLSHHGIKGQKWGIRRFQLKNGKLTAAGKKRYSEDDEEQKKKAEEDSAPKKKSVSEMSDQELRDAVSRAQLEENYRRYYETPAQQKQVSAGQKFAKEMLKKVVVDPAIDAAAKGMRTSLDKAVNDAFNKKKEESIRDLVKRDIRDLNESQLKRVVDYKDLEKRLNDHNDRDSVMERESKRIDFEQKKLGYEKNLMSRDIMSKQLEKATAEAEKAVKDLEMTSYVKDKEESVHRGQEAVRQMFEAPMALPAPKDDLKHSEVLEHHGIKGQRWGVRRFQNKNGTLTSAGKRRALTYTGRTKKMFEEYNEKHPERSKELNYKIAGLKEYDRLKGRRQDSNTNFLFAAEYGIMVSTAVAGVTGLAMSTVAASTIAAGKEYVYKKRLTTLTSIYKSETENTLKHHGIKGQKWGVRRFQNKDGTLTSAGKKRYSDDDDVIMKKGETGKHVSGERRVYLNKKETYLYDPNNEHDRQVYEGAYAKYIELGKGFTNQYIHEYKFKKDLVSPSAEKRVEIFIDMYRDKPMLFTGSMNQVRSSVQNRNQSTLTDKNKNVASYKKEYDENTSDKDLRKYGYDTFTALQEYGSARSPAVKAYYKEVEKRGYNALVDDNNRNVYNDAVKPFIVLNGKKTLKEVNSELLTGYERGEQEEKLREYMKKRYGRTNIAL